MTLAAVDVPSADQMRDLADAGERPNDQLAGCARWQTAGWRAKSLVAAAMAERC